jgi:membrane protease YdiL (CAAX protease family)
MSPLERSLVAAAATAAVDLALLAPLLVAALASAPAACYRRLAAVAGLFALECFCLMAPRGPWLDGTQWNWQGKFLEVLWPLAYVALTKSDPARFGIRVRLNPGSGAALWRTAAGVLVFAAAVGLFPGPRPARETVWFEPTMPGLGEELVFRGILQSLLNEIFPKRWTVMGAKAGWGWLLTAALFGVLHGVRLSPWLQIEVPSMIFPLVFGLLVGWVRERSGSVWPGMLLHNMLDALPLLVRLAV